jgi:outer membrane protein assembly factor BamB
MACPVISDRSSLAINSSNPGWHRLLPLLLWLIAAPMSAADWLQYRGPNHDGVSTDRIITNWTGSVTNPVWLVPVTNSFSSFTVRGGLAYSQVNRFLGGTNRETCVALNAATGAELWSRDFEDCYYPLDTGVGSNNGPRTTPVIDGDSVFILTSHLKLYRLNATNGTTIWQKDLLNLYGGTIVQNENAASPLIENGLIFVSTAANTSNLMAFSTTNGSLVWRAQNEFMTHATPVVTTIHGVRQVIFATRAGLVSVNPPTGALLWKFNYPFTVQANSELIVSPVVYEDIVFIAGSRSQLFGSLARRVTLTNSVWSTTQLWAQTTTAMQVASYWMTPVVVDGFLYGQFSATAAGESASGALKCVELQTGIVQWSVNDFGRGGILLVNNHLVALTERGALVLIQATNNAYTELGRFQAIPNYNITSNKCWNTPAVADGKIYIRSTYFGAMYDLSQPALRLDPPLLQSPNKFQLTIRSSDGSAVNASRLTAMEVRRGTNLIWSPDTWPKLTNSLVLSNGVVVITNLDGNQPRQYFIVTEPK